MGTQQVGLRDVSQGRAPSRLRLLTPLRYLAIKNPEKAIYDYWVPLGIAGLGFAGYWLLDPKPKLFGDGGLLNFTRDLLIMAVPFMIGALAAVAMGSPGAHMDSRPRGTVLRLDGRPLTMRQFVCYLLGYLSFIGMTTLGVVVAATVLHDDVVKWGAEAPRILAVIELAGAFGFALLLSVLSVTVFWALYFLTDVVNHTD